jgi:hypothetical protein
VTGALAGALAALLFGLGACAGTVGAASGTSSATPEGAFLTLEPSSVRHGDSIVISGVSGDCPAGDAVTVISKAFPLTQEFAGVPAVTAIVQSDGSFGTDVAIPSTTQPGDYDVTARCGGGNLGLLLHLTVTG